MRYAPSPEMVWATKPNLSTFKIAVVVMVARTNSILDLQPLIPGVLACLAEEADLVDEAPH